MYEEIISKFADSFADMDSLQVNSDNKVRILNRMLTDLDHYLELNELTSEQLIKLTARRMEVLKTRRQYKNAIELIESVLPRQRPGGTARDYYERRMQSFGMRSYVTKELSLEDALKEGELCVT